MVDVIYEPFKEIVILDKVKYSLPDFIRALAMASGAAIAQWTEGIVFVHRLLPWTDQTVKEATEGRVYWAHVVYAELPRYQSLLESDDRRIKVGVIDVSSSEVLRDAIRRLRVIERLPEYWLGKRRRSAVQVPATPPRTGGTTS